MNKNKSVTQEKYRFFRLREKSLDLFFQLLGISLLRSININIYCEESTYDDRRALNISISRRMQLMNSKDKRVKGDYITKFHGR